MLVELMVLFVIIQQSIKLCLLYFYFFNLNLFIYFNQRLINLQYCIGFAIHQHESATGVHVFPILAPLPPPSLYHPSGSSQCTSPKHPVSYIEPGLAIRFLYDIIHVLMPFSQIIPPSTESKRLFYTSVSLLLSCIQSYQRRQWHPTPVLLLGKSHGRRSLLGCNPWGR